MPDTIATIIAVSTEAMILFHSKDDIATLRLGNLPRQIAPNYHAFGARDEPGMLSLSRQN